MSLDDNPVVEVKLPDGTLREMTKRQVLRLAALSHEHPGGIWHFNECGCCVCFHPPGGNHRGWIINSSGDADYEEMPPHEHEG